MTLKAIRRQHGSDLRFEEVRLNGLGCDSSDPDGRSQKKGGNHQPISVEHGTASSDRRDFKLAGNVRGDARLGETFILVANGGRSLGNVENYRTELNCPRILADQRASNFSSQSASIRDCQRQRNCATKRGRPRGVPKLDIIGT